MSKPSRPRPIRWATPATSALDRLTALQDGFDADRRETERKLDALVQHEEDILVRLRSELADAQHRNGRRPVMVLLGALLGLSLGIALGLALC